MKKIAIIGPHHQDGWHVLKKMNFDVFEITDLTKKNLIKELFDVEGIGELEAAVTSGGLSTMPWTFEGKINLLENKTLRYQGHWEQM